MYLYWNKTKEIIFLIGNSCPTSIYKVPTKKILKKHGTIYISCAKKKSKSDKTYSVGHLVKFTYV